METNKYSIPEVSVRLVLKEVGAYYAALPIKDKLTAVNAVKDIVNDLDREELIVVNLDVKLKPINYHVVSVGGLDGGFIDVANVFKSAILSNACGIMVFHNHPSGNEEPSRDDISTTKRLIEAGKIMGIKVIDHIIIGNGTGAIYSFFENYNDMFD